MNASDVDLELLAAVLDGRATPSERSFVMQRIAGSQELYATFLEAVAIQRAMLDSAALPTDGVGVATVPPLVPRRSWRARAAMPLTLLAASIVVVFVARQRTAGTASMSQIASAVRVPGAQGSGAVARALGPRWDEPSWSVSRGGGTTAVASARAFRAGVRFVQLAVAANAADTVAFAAASEQLRDLLAESDGAAPLIAQLTGAPSSLAASDLSRRVALGEQVRAMLSGGEWFDLGSWTESGLLAARRGDSAFFATDAPAMLALRSLLQRDEGPRERWREAIDPLRRLTERGPVVDLAAFERALVALAERAGG